MAVENDIYWPAYIAEHCRKVDCSHLPEGEMMNEIDRSTIAEIPCAYCGKTCFMHCQSLHDEGKALAFCDGNCADNWDNQRICGVDTEAQQMEENA